MGDRPQSSRHDLAGSRFENSEQVSADNVAQLLLDNPTMIKRPVLEQHGAITVGFKPDIYEAFFNPDLN